MKTKLTLFLLMSISFYSCQSKAQTTYTIETSLGNMKVVLYDETPLHKANFEKFVEEGTYNGTIFHRVIQNFMIQGGDPSLIDPGFVEETIPAEIRPNLIHKKGALAAARMGDGVNPERHSSVQFYIVQGRTYSEDELQNMMDFNGKFWNSLQKETYKVIGGTPFLDRDYTVFGEVTEGLDILDRIAAVQTAPGDRPIQDVTIIRIVKDN
jgi:Peptidyl-prolyl cis-trans isomerase (rotamase) - cyclophilin family